MAEIVQFARGPKSKYSLYSPQEKLRKVYFSQDTNEVIVNDVVYGLNLKAIDLNILSEVEILGPGSFVFHKTNGTKTTVNIPVATIYSDGLLSKEDKQFLDSIPEIYATKEEVVNNSGYTKEETDKLINDASDKVLENLIWQDASI